MQPAAQAAGCFCCPANGELAPRTTDNENRQEVRRTGGCMIPKGCPDPRGRPRDAASAAPRNLVHPRIVLSPNSRTSAPLWTYKTPHLVRQGPISGYGAPQPPAQRMKAASRCGCLTKSVIVDFFQGHLDRCHFRRTFFDLFWLTVLIQSFFI